MHELPLLINIAVALVAAFIGGMVARFLKLPQIVGYMIAGIAIGPFTPGFSGDIATISQLAELGVVFLMFGVGLHFSIDDLWKVRSIAIPGAIGQMFVTTILGYLFATFLGWSQSASVVLGLAISIASTVVLLRGLMDNGLLNTQHGQAAVGWLILEDIATVLILLLMPTLASGEGGLDWGGLGLTLLKAGAFFISLIFIGRKLIPWMLMGSARSGSRELFLLAVLAVSVGIALAATEIFGVSIALGAFAAGVVVSESKLSHQVSADILPFRDAFSVLFFVSIGMMVNIHYLGMNVFALIALVLLVTIGKYLVTLLMGVLIRRPARTFLVVAAGLSQIGEFSFILGQAGMALGLLDQNQYSMILASALLSIAVNPLMYQTTMPVERFLRKRPRFWRLFDRHSGEFEMPESMSDHVVVIGFGRVGQHIVNVLVELGIPLIVVEADLDRVEKLMERNIPALYGDAGTSEVIFHAHLTTARLLVVTTPEEAVTDIIVSDARSVAPDLHIVARGASDVGVAQLYELGANYVIHPELEGGLQILRRTLLELGYSLRKVQQYTDAVRSDQYDSAINTKEERHFLTELLIASDNIGLSWLSLHDDSDLIGKTLIDAKLRELTGASVVAILRNGKLIGNPPARTVLKKGDVIGLIGSDDDIEKARAVFGHAI
ncbi:MAG: cation:proton antiporter [Pyrinomonadaceae bacterium]